MSVTVNRSCIGWSMMSVLLILDKPQNDTCLVQQILSEEFFYLFFLLIVIRSLNILICFTLAMRIKYFEVVCCFFIAHILIIQCWEDAPLRWRRGLLSKGRRGRIGTSITIKLAHLFCFSINEWDLNGPFTPESHILCCISWA